MPARVAARAALQQSYQCPSCTFAMTVSRTFSQSAVPRQIGPESPRFIEVPQPPQQTTPDRSRIRGVLPVPRDIFSGQAPGRGIDKADPHNVAKSTKEPSKDGSASASAKSSPQLEWRERMAAQRRQNLREGLQALKERRVRSDAQLRWRGKQRQQEREALLHTPEREDERLTSPTVDLNLQQVLKGGLLPDPERAARLKAMKERTEAKHAAAKEERADALHSLYVNARHFITTEAQLSQAIDEEFGTVAAPKQRFSTAYTIPSVWAHGKPATVQDMLNHASGKGGRGAVASSTRGRSGDLIKDRINRMAEELTGGRGTNDSLMSP